MRRPKTSTRTYTHAHRQRLDRVIEHYLLACYARKTAARASVLATAYLEVTAPYLSRIAPEIVGTSLRDYLRLKQLAYAEQLLRTTPLTIDEIALRAGFGTPRTFYRWFERKHGMTPSAFRKIKK